MKTIEVLIKKSGQRNQKITCVKPANGYTDSGEPLAKRPNVYRSYRSTAAQEALSEALRG